MCGIVGIVSSHAPVSNELYDALLVLQHRGQDAAGIVTAHSDRCHVHKGNGLVSEVFNAPTIDRLQGNMGIGHVRYPTAGTSSSHEAQPLYVNSPHGICLAHNGNLTNVKQLREEYFSRVRRHINTLSDSEILLNVFANELQTSSRVEKLLSPEDVFEAVGRVHQICRGGYAVVSLIVGVGIVGFRDPRGIRPLIVGVKRGVVDDFIIASESATLAVLGYEILRDVQPGEAVFIDAQGQFHSQDCADNSRSTPCIFEHVYFARPDSVMDGISVYKARLRMGERLANTVLDYFPNGEHDIDVVIPIPETSRTAAIPVAHQLNVKLREGFVKNHYIGRTFIMPGQSMRQRGVRHKLNAIALEFEKKNVLLVEDSIVRGTTMTEIVRKAKNAGARKVYVASAAPPVRFPNVFGIDMPASQEFIAYNRSIEQIRQIIGADLLIYQKLKDLISAAQEGNPHIEQFECSVFDGHYYNEDVDAGYLAALAESRNDESKKIREVDFDF